MAERIYRFYIRQGEFELDLEGDQEFVESYLEAFLEGGAVPLPETAPPAAETGRARRAAKVPAGKGRGTGILPVDAALLSAYMRGRRPRNHKERILCYFGFLTSTGVREWGAPYLMACYGAAGEPFPAAGRQYFQILKKQGLVEKSGTRGLWKLTVRGVAQAEALGRPAKAVKKARRPKRAKGATARPRPAPKAKRAKRVKKAKRPARKTGKVSAPEAGTVVG